MKEVMIFIRSDSYIAKIIMTVSSIIIPPFLRGQPPSKNVVLYYNNCLVRGSTAYEHPTLNVQIYAAIPQMCSNKHMYRFKGWPKGGTNLAITFV